MQQQHQQELIGCDACGGRIPGGCNACRPMRQKYKRGGGGGEKCNHGALFVLGLLILALVLGILGLNIFSVVQDQDESRTVSDADLAAVSAQVAWIKQAIGDAEQQLHRIDTNPDHDHIKQELLALKSHFADLNNGIDDLNSDVDKVKNLLVHEHFEHYEHGSGEDDYHSDDHRHHHDDDEGGDGHHHHHSGDETESESESESEGDDEDDEDDDAHHHPVRSALPAAQADEPVSPLRTHMPVAAVRIAAQKQKNPEVRQPPPRTERPVAVFRQSPTRGSHPVVPAAAAHPQPQKAQLQNPQQPQLQKPQPQQPQLQKPPQQQPHRAQPQLQRPQQPSVQQPLLQKLQHNVAAAGPQRGGRKAKRSVVLLEDDNEPYVDDTYSSSDWESSSSSSSSPTDTGDLNDGYDGSDLNDGTYADSQSADAEVEQVEIVEYDDEEEQN